jgi:hypothetical protein
VPIWAARVLRDEPASRAAVNRARILRSGAVRPVSRPMARPMHHWSPVKISARAASRFGRLLVGAVFGVACALAVGACILGPKQDDPAEPGIVDTGRAGGTDTGTGMPDGGVALDAAYADTYDPTTGLDGCKQADADGGDAAPRDGGDVGCGDASGDAPSDSAPSDVKDEGGSDVATGG